MRKILSFVIILLLIGVTTSSISGYYLENKPLLLHSNRVSQNIGNGLINITVYEAWELLNDTSNGIQIPIDMRNDTEWAEGRIDTPHPENPIHIPLETLNYSEFWERYNGKDIIPYYRNKSGYRFLIFIYHLLYNNFTGTIYLWPGGFEAWMDAGLPICNNSPPNEPIIKGPIGWPPGKGKPPGTYNYSFNATDPDGDNVSYTINWGDGAPDNNWSDYYRSGKEVIFSHTYKIRGTFLIEAKAKDIHGAVGPIGTLEVEIIKGRQIINLPFFQHINPKIEPLDNKNEIVSFIRGAGWTDIERLYKIGEIHNLEILTNRGGIHMTSIAINPERIIPLRLTIFARPQFLDIPLFYGLCIGSPVPYSAHRIIGFAIGDIEWW